MNKLYLCIHGHFYQPPRENPWTGEIDVQPSAAPFHNWNERITEECYEPNGIASIKNSKNKIVKIINNYEHINFNFGPTLIDWFKEHAPDVLEKIVEGDQLSQKKHEGHGNAIAQVYNHIIMPLATSKDQDTQIKWGLKHFKNIFKREAQGMWLAETAINMTTVKALINNNIKFTVLSPTQARKIRALDGDKWIDVSNNNINPRHPYRIYDVDESGLSIKDRYLDVFFYDGPISTAVSFEDLLINAENFGKRIKDAFDTKDKEAQCLNIASDGEAYGHHKKFGDMALAYLYNKALEKLNIIETNYSSFLEKFPPKYEVRLKDGPIHLGTSWSCSHGVARWYDHCGCHTGGEKGWTQHWRRPLREALNILKDELDEIFNTEGVKYFKSPWEARNNYIDILIDPSEQNKEQFFKNNCNDISPNDHSKILNLLEMQRFSMLMFTSCGWFFTEISGIETLQILAYAARAIEIASDFTTYDIEKQFLQVLAFAHSNAHPNKNGADIYRDLVLPMKPSHLKNKNSNVENALHP